MPSINETKAMLGLPKRCTAGAAMDAAVRTWAPGGAQTLEAVASLVSLADRRPELRGDLEDARDALSRARFGLIGWISLVPAGHVILQGELGGPVMAQIKPRKAVVKGT